MFSNDDGGGGVLQSNDDALITYEPKTPRIPELPESFGYIG